MIVEVKAKFIKRLCGAEDKMLTVDIDDDPGTIKVGDLYIGKRNTGWELGIAGEIVDGYIVSRYGPILDMIYTYNITECRKVKAILFS